MTNFQVYKKTIPFSFIQFAVDMVALLIVAGCATAGFFILNQSTNMALVGLFIGLIVGVIIAIAINYLISNRIKAAQIAMMCKGVTEDKLPEHTVKAGFNEIKGRFGKITLFFVITNAIKSIFRQLGRTINKIGTAVGGDVGNGVTSAIDGAIQTVIAYLCDCCLAWIFYRKDVNAFKAGCEGAVIFFKHGKTLIRNIGRIFGMGLLSLVVVGGAIFGILFAIFSQFPNMFVTLAAEIAKIGSDVPAFLTDPTILSIFVCAVVAIVIWSSIHSVAGRPFILVGVMRNFMNAGIKDLPTEADFNSLAEKSPKFAKLQKRIAE